jgi:hypothetical protein
VTIPRYFKTNFTGRRSNKFKKKDALEISKFFGGKFIKGNFNNLSSPFTWTCQDGHTFKRPPYLIKYKKTFCNICSSTYLGEEIARNILEKMTGKLFPKTRHKELISKKGAPLELDGFCEELNVAFEHQGKHHFNDKIYGGKTNLKKQVVKDKLKKSLLKIKKIKLIEFQEMPQLLKVQDGINKTKDFLKKNKIKHKLITIKDIYPLKFNSRLKILRKLATEKKGKLLSETYLGMHHDYRWKCSNDHKFIAKGYNIHNGWWCRKCSTPEYSIKDLKIYAKKKNGECMSKIYLNKHSTYKFKCDKNHIWETTWHSIHFSNTWCPKCSGHKPYTLDDLKKYAEQKKGLCLSKKYSATHKKYKWKCKNNHTWLRTWHSTNRYNSWCLKCKI